MLKPLDKLNLTNQQRFDNVMVHHWIAVDPDTGATLTRSFGRTKYGDVRCTLILPKKTPVEAGGWWRRLAVVGTCTMKPASLSKRGISRKLSN